MSSQGPTICGTGADVAATGGHAWTNPGNITADDATYASASLLGTGSTDYLAATNFGFSIPNTATINGVLVEWERLNALGTVQDQLVQLFINGALNGNNYASGSNWPGAEAWASYGGSSDTWGLAGSTITPANVNASGFGCYLQAQSIGGAGSPKVDACRITIYYTAAAGYPDSLQRVRARAKRMWFKIFPVRCIKLLPAASAPSPVVTLPARARISRQFFPSPRNRILALPQQPPAHQPVPTPVRVRQHRVSVLVPRNRAMILPHAPPSYIFGAQRIRWVLRAYPTLRARPMTLPAPAPGLMPSLIRLRYMRAAVVTRPRPLAMPIAPVSLLPFVAFPARIRQVKVVQPLPRNRLLTVQPAPPGLLPSPSRIRYMRAAVVPRFRVAAIPIAPVSLLPFVAFAARMRIVRTLFPVRRSVPAMIRVPNAVPLPCPTSRRVDRRVNVIVRSRAVPIIANVCVIVPGERRPARQYRVFYPRPMLRAFPVVGKPLVMRIRDRVIRQHVPTPRNRVMILPQKPAFPIAVWRAPRLIRTPIFYRPLRIAFLRFSNPVPMRASQRLVPPRMLYSARRVALVPTITPVDRPLLLPPRRLHTRPAYPIRRTPVFIVCTNVQIVISSKRTVR